MPTKPVVIYVEDEQEHFDYIAPVIESNGFQVVRVEHHGALPAALAKHPDAAAIVSDVDVPDVGEGIKWARAYQQTLDQKPFVLISTNGRYVTDIRKMGVEFFPKPILAIEGEEDETAKKHGDIFKRQLGEWFSGLAADNKGFSDGIRSKNGFKPSGRG